MVKKRQRFLLTLTRIRSLFNELLGFHFAISVTSLQRNRETIDPTCSLSSIVSDNNEQPDGSLMAKVVNAADYCTPCIPHISRISLYQYSYVCIFYRTKSFYFLIFSFFPLFRKYFPSILRSKYLDETRKNELSRA